LVVTDMEMLKANPMCYRLVSQQVGSADSICANIEEGYGRLSRMEKLGVQSVAELACLAQELGIQPMR
jgi:four helix bundle protein